MDELLARCREAEAQSSIGPWSQAREEMIRNAKDKKCRFQSAVFFNLFMFVVRIGVLIIFQIFWASTACHRNRTDSESLRRQTLPLFLQQLDGQIWCATLGKASFAQRL